MRKAWLLVFLFVAGGCAGSRSAEETARPAPAGTAVQAVRVTRTIEATSTSTATSAPAAAPSSTRTRRPTRTLSPTPTPPPPTGTFLIASTPAAERGGVLVYTESVDGQVVLAQVDVQGGIHLISEPGRVHPVKTRGVP